jgi:hypothetical protein
MTMRYEVVRQHDAVLRERLKDLAKVRRRFGYRRLHVRRGGGRKRAMGTRAPMVVPLMPNQRPLSRFACKPREGSGVTGLCIGPADGWPQVPGHDRRR